MKNLSTAALHYLESLGDLTALDGYLCLNCDNELIFSYGQISNINLTKLDKQKRIPDTIPYLEGLLPTSTQSNSIIHNVHIDNNHFFDIHLFSEETVSWILFINTTGSAVRLQEEQQIRLNEDFDNDKRKTGS